MRLKLGRRGRRSVLASILLVAFAARAFIPAGFMPASHRPFSLDICGEDLPAGMLAQIDPLQSESTGMPAMDMSGMDMSGMDMASMQMQRMPAGSQRAVHHPQGSMGHREHCVFATVCGVGPVPHLPTASDFSSSAVFCAPACASIAVPVRVVHLPQPRAPPLRLS